MKSERTKIVIGIGVGVVCVGIIAFGFFKFMGDVQAKDPTIVQSSLSAGEDNFELQPLLQYRYPYMGDNTNTSRLFHALPLGQTPMGIDLYSSKLSVKITYYSTMDDIGKERFQKAVLYNATAAFSLIENLQFVEFEVDGNTYPINRDTIQTFFLEQGMDAFSLEESQWRSMVALLDDKEMLPIAWERCVNSITSSAEVILSNESLAGALTRFKTEEDLSGEN